MLDKACRLASPIDGGAKLCPITFHQGWTLAHGVGARVHETGKIKRAHAQIMLVPAYGTFLNGIDVCRDTITITVAWHLPSSTMYLH